MTTWGKLNFENNYFAIARGEVDGFSHLHRSGYNPQIDSNTDPETIWTGGGLYPWSEFNTPRTLYVQSTSALESGTVTVYGLDSNFNQTQEVFEIVGTATHVSSLTFSRVNGAFFTSPNSNLGDITVRVGSSTGVVVSDIPIGFGVSLSTAYTVPFGKTAFIVSGNFTVQKGEGAQVQFLARYFGDNFKIAHIAEAFQNTYRYDFNVPVMLPAKSDLDVLVYQVVTNGTRVTANYDLILVDDHALHK